MVDMELWKEELNKLPHGGKRINKNNINWWESIKNKVKFIYDNISGEVEIIDYDGKHLSIRYLDEPIFKISTGHFQRCQLGKLLGIITDKFKLEIGDIKRDLIITDRKIIKDRTYRNRKYYKYKCLKCGYECGEHYKNGIYQKEYWILEEHLLKGSGCACCCNSSKITVPKINDMWTTNPEQAKLLADPQDGYKYTQCSHIKVDWKCPDCGNIIKNKSIDNTNRYGLSCPKCGDGISYPEKIMYSVLKELNIKFKYQYSPKWCKYEYKNKLKRGKYDFYFKLNNQEYIVETDGIWHHKDNKMSGQTKEESKQIDIIKDKLADKHNIIVIRIDCKESKLEYIKDKILKSKLNNIFDFSKIDWIKCEQFSLNNLVKKVCEIKRDNPNFTTVDIRGKIKLHRQTIIRYLKQGTKLGWCNYNPKEESFKGSSRAGKSNGKPVIIYKNGILLTSPFSSCCELERQSEGLFGIKLNHKNISKVCTRKGKTYKGFTFKYI